jgi:hypothetical protein
MDYRRLEARDLSAVLALQEDNLLDNLTPAQRGQGFLSARFSAAQFTEMAADVAVMVAADADEIAGYLCASSLAFNRRVPLLAAMIERFPQIQFLGRPLSAQRCLIYGPVCVAASRRGRGVLRGLYAALRAQIAGDYDAGVLFIAKDNPRSLAAHADGLGMTLVGDFAFAGGRYWILAFTVPPPRHC